MTVRIMFKLVRQDKANISVILEDVKKSVHNAAVTVHNISNFAQDRYFQVYVKKETFQEKTFQKSSRAFY